MSILKFHVFEDGEGQMNNKKYKTQYWFCVLDWDYSVKTNHGFGP